MNEPGLEELKQIRRDLYAAKSTDDNVKKIKAIEAQILRREAALASKEASKNQTANAPGKKQVKDDKNE